MERNIWSRESRALALVVLLVAAAVAAPAAAVPQMVFRGADVSDTTALVGANVTITATVENIGDDGGGFTLEYSENGSQFTSNRVSVPANTERQFNESIQFDDPGVYRIRVNGEVAGDVRVRRAVADVETETDDQRTLVVQGRSVPTDESYAVDLPAATNRSFALEGWSTQSSGENYEQMLTEYSDLSAAADLPSENRSSLVGLLTVDSNVSVESAAMQFAIDDARLSDADLGQDEVTVFQRNGSRWEPLDTTVAEEGTRSAVYAANATTESDFAVGRIDADISVTDTSLSTETTETGQRLNLEATLRNDGSVDGEYVAGLLVNDEAVNTTTVTVPAAGETTVTLTHDVGSAGTYDMALNDTGAGSIVVTEGQIMDSSDESGDNGTGTDEAGEENTESIGGSLPDVVPATIFGIDTLYVGGTVGAVLGLLLGVLLMSRRGGGGNTGDFEL